LELYTKQRRGSYLAYQAGNVKEMHEQAGEFNEG